MARVRKDPLERRQELIDISLELFRSQGYEQTMVQDICSKAGVAKGTFFYYFPAKEDVLRAIFSCWTDTFIGRYTKRAAGKDSIGKLLLLLEMFDAENPMDEMVDRLFEESRGDLADLLWKECRTRGFQPLLRDILQQGQREGMMRLTDPDTGMDFFWAILDVTWPEEQKSELDDAHLEVRRKTAGKLIEMLFGMESGSLMPFYMQGGGNRGQP